jgi:hypothetical protein
VGGDDRTVDAVRAAAAAFCREFDLAPEKVDEILRNPPLLGPVTVERDGRTVTAYRWLGSGRGSDYVQVEVDATGRIEVFGARGDSELGPWRPDTSS